MNFINTVMFNTSTTFLNYSISKGVDEISEIDSASSTIRGSTNSRYLIEL
jgi:hypothetical protein